MRERNDEHAQEDRGGSKDSGEIILSASETIQSIDGTLITSDIPTDRHDHLIGKTVGLRYEIVSFIGQGGMSAVYKAIDTKSGRNVAVKLLLPHLVTDKTTFQRFQLEAKAASSLSHPNIVTIYDYGATEGEHPYIVMDYIEGTGLHDAITMLRGLPIERTVLIFVQIADALHCAHSCGVLHRDLKPSNVLLLHHGPLADFVKIVDFGIAKLLPREGDESLHLTKTGEVFGSPFYMSPEQCRGDKVDARSDVYSMGCLMYELIAGRPPLVGNNLLETLFKHVNEAPSSFATACPDKAVPEKLEAIVFKSLHKDPEHRYQSMRDLKKDLEAFFDSIEPGWISKARLKFELVRLKVVPLVAREKKILAFGLAVTVVLIIVAAQLLNVYFADVNEPPPGPGIAWAVTQPAPQSQQIDFEQNLAMAQKVMAGIQKLEGTKSSRYIHALGKLALFYEKNGHYGEATEAYKQAYTLSRDMEGIRSWSTKEAMIAYADALMKGGEFAKAEEQYQLLIQQLQLESPNPEPHIYLHALQHLGDAQMLLQRYGEAIVSYETALKNIDRRKDSHSGQTTYAAMLSRLADCYRISGQYSRAQPVYARAYDCWKNLLKRDEAAPVLLSRRFIGYCHWQLGQYKRARGCYESVLPLMEKTLGAANQTTLSAMREYSQLMWDKGNYWHSVVTHWRIQECRAKKGSTG